MGGRCKYCGGEVEWTDNRGWYEPFCEECAHKVADGADLRAKFDTDTGERL